MPSPSIARRATIRDVATVAGVSVSAASKAVRGAYGVSPQLKAKVDAAVLQLGYRPHAGARAMRGQSFTIGLVISALDSPFQIEVAEGIDQELRSGPYQSIIVNGTSRADHQRRAIESLLDRQIDGLVIVAPWIETAYLEEIARGVPTVAVALHGPVQHLDTVVTDEAMGARLMVDHLVSLGHRDIVYTSMTPAAIGGGFVLSHTAREEGFVEAMRAHNLEPHVVDGYFSEEGGYAAASRVLAAGAMPTAVFAGADIAALGVLRAIEEAGLSVPDAISLGGYDNIYISTLKRVSLTTIDQAGQLTGEAAVRLLMERIGGRTRPVQYGVSPRLIARGTTAPPR